MWRRGLAAAGIALVVAGCGGGHKTEVTLPAHAFVEAANRICAQSTTRGSRLARLRSLRPPSSMSELYGRWLVAEQDALVALRARTHSATTTPLDPEIALAIAQGKIAGFARRLGAQTCALATNGTMPP